MASAHRKRSSNGTVVAQRSIASSFCENVDTSSISSKLTHRMITIKIVDNADTTTTTKLSNNKNQKQTFTVTPPNLPVQGPIYIPPRVNQSSDTEKPTTLVSDIFSFAGVLQQSLDSYQESDDNISSSATSRSTNKLQRFPIKTQSQNGDVQSSAGVAQNGMSSNNSKSGNSVNKRATVHSPDEDSKRFLLNNLDELNTGDTENQCGTPEKALFVQELLLSLLSSPPQVTSVDTQHQDDTESSSFSSKSMKESEQSVSKQACGSVEQQVAGGRKTTEKKSKAAESKKKSTRRKEAPKSATSPMPMSNGTTLTKEQTDISPSSPSPSSRQKSTAAASAAVMPSSSPVEKEVGNSAASVVDEPPRNIDDDRPPSPSARSPAHHGGSARLYLGGGTTTTASSGPVRIDHRCASAASAAAEYNSGNTSDQVSTGAAMKNNLR